MNKNHRCAPASRRSISARPRRLELATGQPRAARHGHRQRPIAASVLATGLIEHLRTDGLTWRPKKPSSGWFATWSSNRRDRPVMADWLATGRCRRSIFNLKLPMKKRHEEVERCRNLIDQRMRAAGLKYILRIKHLYTTGKRSPVI
jgi:23S rRNA C2498 (ribose-2'-O)-methylase RlmM